MNNDGRNLIKKATTIRRTTTIAVVFSTIVILTLSILSSSLTWQVQPAYAHHVIEQIPVGKGPMQMSLANNTLYVANVGQPLVSVIDTTANKTIARINTTAGVSTLYAVPKLGKLYVSIFEQPRIEVYDLKTLGFIKNITLPGAILDYWFSPLDNYQKHVILGTGGSSMDYDPVTGMMYVAIYNHDHIEVVDTKTDNAVKTINLPAHPSAVRVDPLSQMVLVTSTAGNRLSFISTKTNEVIGDMVTGNAPWDLAIDQSTHTAYVTHMASYYVSAVYIPTREITANIPTTNFAQSIAVDSSEHKVYFSSIGSLNIVKVDGKSNQIETVIDMDTVPSYLLADSTTHRVYATTNLYDNVIVMGPQSVSTSLPIITVENPSAVVGTIKVHGQDVTPSEPYLNTANKTLTMAVKTADGGNLTLELPRQLIDSKQGNNTDSQFHVTIDGKTSSYQEGQQPITNQNGTQSRVITLFIPKSAAKLEITGTQSIP
jgi:YVTN family beta-propeller protein